MPLPCLYIYFTLLEIHKHSSKFKTQSDIHNHRTRSANLLRNTKFKLKKSENNSLNLNLYNKIPISIKQLNFNKFKMAIKNILLLHCFYSVDDFLSTKIN